MIFTGSNVQGILDALSGRIGKSLRIGDAADAENDRSTRAVWIPRSRRHRPITEQPVDPTSGRRIGKSVMQKGYVFEVRCYGSDFDDVDRIADAIIAGLHDLLGPANFDMLPASAQIEDGGAVSQGFALPVSIVLWAPVLESAFTAGQVSAATQGGSVTNTQGGAGEAIT